MNVALDQPINLGLLIFLDHRSLSSIDQQILMTILQYKTGQSWTLICFVDCVQTIRKAKEFNLLDLLWIWQCFEKLKNKTKHVNLNTCSVRSAKTDVDFSSRRVSTGVSSSLETVKSTAKVKQDLYFFLFNCLTNFRNWRNMFFCMF